MNTFLHSFRNYSRTGGYIWVNVLWFVTGLYVLDWRPEIILFAYLFETIVTGLVYLAKMFMILRYSEVHAQSTLPRIQKIAYGIFTLTLFSIVFFGFVWGQSVFLFLMYGQADPAISTSPSDVWDNILYLSAQPDMQEAFAGIVFSNLLQAARFFMGHQYRHLTLEQIFHLPFIRIFVQQLTVIAGGFVFFVMGYGIKGLAMLLILLKALSDIFLLRSEEKEIKGIQDTGQGTQNRN